MKANLLVRETYMDRNTSFMGKLNLIACLVLNSKSPRIRAIAADIAKATGEENWIVAGARVHELPKRLHKEAAQFVLEERERNLKGD